MPKIQRASPIRSSGCRGEERLWRLRVGDWRVIFNQDMVVVHVVRVASRGSAYD
ncbi:MULTISPECIES: type II toxin-antitoxin system RelE/ParE family toxin [Sphingomonadales]